MGACCGGLPIDEDKYKSIEEIMREKQAQKDKKESNKKITEKKEKQSTIISEFTKEKIIKLASIRSKTSLFYISNISKTPIPFIRDILLKYPNNRK